MKKSKSSMAEKIARAANAFERQRTGHAPQSVTVMMSGETLVITLPGSLSPVERELAKTPAGATEVKEFHRALFNNSAAALRDEIKKITGVEVRDATAEVETTSGSVVQVFNTGTMVQVFLLGGELPAESWSGAPGLA
jgi:uncharacterized protein YbcI